MAGFYGAKKRRKEEYLEKKKEKQKEAFKEHRKTAKKVKTNRLLQKMIKHIYILIDFNLV